MEKEFREFLSPDSSKVPGLIVKQLFRRSELREAFRKETADLRESHRDRDKKFIEDKNRDKATLDKKIRGKSHAEKSDARKEWNRLWKKKRVAEKTRKQNELWFLKGRQTHEMDRMKTMFAQEKEKSKDPGMDSSRFKDASDTYLTNHASSDYLIALGQGKKPKKVVTAKPARKPGVLRWLGIMEDRVGSGDSSIEPDREPDGVFELTIEGPVKDLVLMTSDSNGKPCCDQQWDTLTAGMSAPKGTLFSDPKQTWVLGVWVPEQRDKNQKGVMNEPDGSIKPGKDMKWDFVRLHVADTGYFHKGQNFVLHVIRPSGETERLYTRIESEPVITDLSRHEPVQERKISIKSLCREGEVSYISDTSWNPPSFEVNQGDKVILTVYGPYRKAPKSCYSVSLKIKDYGILLSKIKRGTKQRTSFLASKSGEFKFVDIERGAQTGTTDFREETLPGTFIVHKNVPPPEKTKTRKRKRNKKNKKKK